MIINDSINSDEIIFREVIYIFEILPLFNYGIEEFINLYDKNYLNKKRKREEEEEEEEEEGDSNKMLKYYLLNEEQPPTSNLKVKENNEEDDVFKDLSK
uniref:Uncharacterized protein n=1 Tax=Meloidogyne hapla TaxID=6305 RepID=A0A1I8B680_MELHA